MAKIETILVVGGGVAGLTTAAALHRHGFTTELVERQQSWHALGAGFLVQANGMRMLLSLGLAAGAEGADADVRRCEFGDEGRGRCFRRPNSRRCGASQVPASGFNGPICNARFCWVWAIYAADSAHQSYP